MRVEALKPRPECPEPDRWAAPDDWATETDVSRFIGDLVRVLKPDFVVETGAYHGFTSAQIGLALIDLERGSAVSLENHLERATEAEFRCAGLPVTIVRGSSLDYVPDRPIDVLFIDSDFAIRMDEVRRFQSYASPRCVVVLHDPVAHPSYPGVPKMMAEMARLVEEQIVQPWLVLPTPRGLALTRYVP